MKADDVNDDWLEGFDAAKKLAVESFDKAVEIARRDMPEKAHLIEFWREMCAKMEPDEAFE